MPIRKLSVQLANQIAAGEVVERPASVVKELLENAVDAGATAITLELKQAGKQLIKVTDNGAGIPKDELVLALAPHATSKISCLEDLAAITTMGFRGEALASIASVSRLTLVSNTKGQDHGYQVEVEGPEQNPQVAPAAHPIGTSVIVRELFFNTPARRRFLKSDKTELTHIKDLVTRLALVNFGIEFTVISDGRTIVQVPAQSKAQLKARITKLLGADFNFPSVSFDNSDPALQQAWEQYQAQSSYQSFRHYETPDPLSTKLMAMYGLILKPPSLIRALPDRILTFLNGRIIADKMVNRALREGYLSVVQDDSSFKPCLRAIIFMQCDPHIVDVNVHPRKDEVRFHESNLIYDAIVTNVRAALLTHHLDQAAKGSLDLPAPPQEPEQSAGPAAPAPTAEPASTAEPAPESSELESSAPVEHGPDLIQERWSALKAKIAAKGKAAVPDPTALRRAVTTYLEQTAHRPHVPSGSTTDQPPLEGAVVAPSELTLGPKLQDIWRQAQAVSAGATAPTAAAPTAPVAAQMAEEEEPGAAAAASSFEPNQAVEETSVAETAAGAVLDSASDEDEGRNEASTELELEDEAPRSLLEQRLRAQRGMQAEPRRAPSRELPPRHPEPVVTPEMELDLQYQGVSSVVPQPEVQTAPTAHSTAPAQFLALVAPNVVLFARGSRYFMAQGSALFAHFLAQGYRQGVKDDTVERSALTLPFALRLELPLLKAYKQTQLVGAAARAGFVVKSQLTRSALEIIAIPKMITGTNLAQVAGQALALIAREHEAINGAGVVSEHLVKCLSQAKRYELNTVIDAKAMVEHLHPDELDLMVAEAQTAQGTLDAKTKLRLSLGHHGFAICELDLCRLAYQMLGQ